MTLEEMDRDIVGTFHFATEGMAFLEELVDRFGPRFLGTEQERGAAQFISERMTGLEADHVEVERFTCPGWVRRETAAGVTRPVQRPVGCIALPYCAPGTVEGPLLYVAEGDLRTYAAKQREMKGAVVMANTANPRSSALRMHRSEKLSRAIDAGAVGFIWMRAVAGGLAETGSARFGRFCEAPAIAVSYEEGHALLRLAKRGPVHLRIHSTNENRMVETQNVFAEFRGRTKPDEIVVLGAHYDAHDIGQGAMDNGSGLAVVLEAARVLRRYRDAFKRTLRIVAFGGEEMGLHGSRHHADRHRAETMRFMLNLDGSARSMTATLYFPGWPDGLDFVRGQYEGNIDDEASLWLHSDHYSFSAQGVPAAIVMSDQPAGSSAAAFRGYGHTAMDTLDKASGAAIEAEASRAARFALRLLTMDEIPLPRKTPAEMREVLVGLGLDKTLRSEGRPVPGE